MKQHSPQTVFIPLTGHSQPAGQARWFARLLPGGIQARLVVLIAMALLPILLLLGWIYQQRYETRRTMAMLTELEVARGIATAFLTYVQGIHEQNHAIGQAILTAAPGDAAKITRILSSMAEHSPGVRNVSWVGPDGIVTASSLPELVGRDLSVRAYLREVQAGQPWAVGDMTQQGIVSEGPTFAIATAIRDEAGELRGMVVSGIEPSRLNELTLLQERPAGGTYAIFDRQGVIVYSNIENQPAWAERIKWKDGDPVLQRVLLTGQEQSGVIRIGSPDEAWITARVPIEGIGFIAGARRPESIAMAPVRRSLIQSAVISLIVWTIAFLMALMIARTISRPLHRLAQDAHLMGTGGFEPQEDGQAPGEVRHLRTAVETMVTTLVQRAEELRESEARFRVLFHNRHTPMLLIDPAAGQIVDANPAASAFYGWSQEELRSMKISQINTLPAGETQQRMGQAVASGTSRLFIFRHRLASGEIRDVEVSSGPIQIQEKDYLFSIIHDVTERLQAERDLRERSEGLALVAEAAQELLKGAEPNVLLEHIYPRLSALLGLDFYIYYQVVEGGQALKLAGQAGIPERMHAAINRPSLSETICGRAVKNREPVFVEDVQHSVDPNTSLIRLLGINAYACHPLIILDRAVGSLSFGSRSRTAFDPQAASLMRTTAALLAAAIHRREAEITLKDYAGKLEESNHDLQQFAFIASHDLQEPLRKIETFGSLLAKNAGQLEHNQRDYLDRMLQAAGRMRRMVFDLLELSRVNTQGRVFEQVNLTDAVNEVLSDLEIQVYRSQGSVVVEPLPEIQADPPQIRQLLQNLIGNALKYHRPGVAPVVRIGGRQVSPGLVEIRIEDNGIGFDPHNAERIFQPFQRLVGRKEYEGTGIGLAICRKIAERHQGSITAESTPGQGSTFVIQLPANGK